MPFDGTQQVDEVGEILLKAKEILVRRGWCVGIRTDDEGRHCALGAIDATSGFDGINMWADSDHPAVQRLAKFTPFFVENMQSGSPFALVQLVASFNNAQTDVQVIYDWFDRAAYNL